MSAGDPHAAGALLRLGLGAGSPVLRRLVARLERDDGPAWFEQARARLACSFALDGIPVPWEQILAGRTAHDRAARSTGDDALAGALGLVLCDAEALLSHGVPCSQGADVADVLLEVAEALPTAWADRLARAALLATAAAPRPRAPVHDRVGRYRLLEPIGRGGMGVVWRAAQAETGRHVALKLMRPELLSRRALDRFAREARLLARLRHPAIAHVIEAGLESKTPHDQPYLAIELVEGEPLVAHAAQRQLALGARLTLFGQVCDAVQHAHEQGVVHRDLKSSNVLVTAEGRVKVLDFGIARALHGSDAHAQTSAGELLGTLSAMSPEQAQGGVALGPTVDVYALGLLLFELLAERPARLLEALSLPEALRRICEQAPAPLRRVAPDLPRDLEVVTGKALAHEPHRRYASVRALADDVERFRRLEPIAARRPTWHYRTGRAVRRHRGLCLAVGAVLLALACGFGVAAAEWLRARRAERDLASVLRTSLELSRSLVESTRPTAEVQGQLAALETALAPALAGAMLDDPALTAAAAAWFEQVADLQQRRGDVETALRNRRSALQIRRALALASPADVDAAARWSVALVKLGDVHGDLREGDRQRECYERALARDREIAAVAPHRATPRDNLVWSLLRVADLRLVQGDFEAAHALMADAAQEADQLLDAHPDRALSHLARTQVRLQRVELLRVVAPGCAARLQLARRAAAVASDLVDREPARAAFRRCDRNAQAAWAAALLAVGRSDEARPAVVAALGEAAAAVAKDGVRAEGWGQLARLHGTMAQIDDAAGDPDATWRHTQGMVDAAERAWRLDTDHPRWRRRWVEALTRAGEAAFQRGDQVLARDYGARALDVAEAFGKGSRAERLHLAQLLAEPKLVERHDVVRATALLEAMRADREDRNVLVALARVHRGCGRDAEAAACEQRIEELERVWRDRFR